MSTSAGDSSSTQVGEAPSGGNGLDTVEQKQAAAVAAIGALPAEVQSGMVATVVQGLDTDEQKQAAAVAAIGALPAEVQPGMVAAVVHGLGTVEQKQAAAEAAIGALPAAVKQQVAQTALGSPDQRTRQILWYMVVVTLTVAVFVFGTMAFVLVYQKKAAEAPLGLATGALGAIVGLIATSPGSRG